jgi:signal transduction histidine kinase
LLFSGVFSFRRQVLTIRDLSLSNIRLQGEKVAFELERRIWQLADDCLRDPLTDQVLPSSEETRDSGRAQSTIADFATLAKRHPIAGLWFAVWDGKATCLDPAGPESPRSAGEADFASVLEKSFRLTGYYAQDRIYTQTIGSGSDIHETLYRSRPGRSTGSYSGIAIDLHWVGAALLPECSSDVMGAQGLAEQIQMEFRRRAADQSGQTSEREMTIGFKTVLPSWELRLPLESLNLTRTAIRREMWFIGLSVLVIASVLILEIFLLFRVFPELQIIQVRSEFISRVSHELRTPLTLIRLYAETLMEAGELSEEERQNCCHIINRESDRLSRMINNVLEFSRIESRSRGGELKERNLEEVVSRTVEVYRHLLTREGFVIDLSLPSDLPPVKYDFEEVTQAILNLLDNARKYSGDSRLIEIRMWSRDAHVVVEIADRGVGVPPEEKADIFQAFYRARGEKTGSGVGLGLYIVRNIMQAHGGKVEVESAPGKGSRFRLLFPVGPGPGSRGQG